MRYVRWILLLALVLCFFKSLTRRPFPKELPILLLPELNSDTVLQKAMQSAYDEAFDPRPICIHTRNNFSLFSDPKDLEENPIILGLRRNLSFNKTALLSEKIIATPKKDFSPEITPVWVTKRSAPIRIEQKKAPKPNAYFESQGWTGGRRSFDKGIF